MLRLTKVVFVAVVVARVSSAPQSESLQPSPGLFEGESGHDAEEASVTQDLRVPPKHSIEPQGGKQSPVTYTGAHEDTSSALLPDSSRIESVHGAPQEAKTPRENTDNMGKETFGDNGRKILGVPPNFPETAASQKTKIKQETEMISEIESILSQVKKQYSVKNPETPQSITDLFKLPLSQVNDDVLQEDAVIEDARQRYMSIWNQEADRLNAPYMKVTKAWPELGMVHMPLITQVTDQIKASESMKEATQAFKSVWERSRTETTSPAATVEPMLNILNNFMHAWKWAETAEENIKIPERGDAINRDQILRKTDVDKSVEKKLYGHDDFFLRTNVMNGLDSRLETLYNNLFNPKRLQPTFEPNNPPSHTDPTALLGSGQFMLSCSVVPDKGSGQNDATPGGSGQSDATHVPVHDHRPINNPLADIRPIIDPFRVRNPIRENPANANMRPVRQQTEQQAIVFNPITVARPIPDSAAVMRPVQDHIAANRPVKRPLSTPVVHHRPIAGHEVLTRPVTRTDGFAPVTRHSLHEQGVHQRYDHRQSEEDFSHSSESGEHFIRRLGYHHARRQ